MSGHFSAYCVNEVLPDSVLHGEIGAGHRQLEELPLALRPDHFSRKLRGSRRVGERDEPQLFVCGGRRAGWSEGRSGKTEGSSCLTTVGGRADGDVAALGVKGELVDVQLTGGDHLHVLV